MQSIGALVHWCRGALVHWCRVAEVQQRSCRGAAEVYWCGICVLNAQIQTSQNPTVITSSRMNFDMAFDCCLCVLNPSVESFPFDCDIEFCWRYCSSRQCESVVLSNLKRTLHSIHRSDSLISPTYILTNHLFLSCGVPIQLYSYRNLIPTSD